MLDAGVGWAVGVKETMGQLGNPVGHLREFVECNVAGRCQNYGRVGREALDEELLRDGVLGTRRWVSHQLPHASQDPSRTSVTQLDSDSMVRRSRVALSWS